MDIEPLRAIRRIRVPSLPRLLALRRPCASLCAEARQPRHRPAHAACEIPELPPAPTPQPTTAPRSTAPAPTATTPPATVAPVTFPPVTTPPVTTPPPAQEYKLQENFVSAAAQIRVSCSGSGTTSMRLVGPSGATGNGVSSVVVVGPPGSWTLYWTATGAAETSCSWITT